MQIGKGTLENPKCANCESAGNKQYHTLRVKVQEDQLALKFVNTTPSSICIKSGQLLGYLDLRSIGVHVVEHEQLLHLHERDITFMSTEQTQEILMESTESWLKAFSQDEEPNPEDPYPWLPDSDIHKKMMDNEILDKFVNLDKSILTEEEKKEFREILHKHKKGFSLQDEIGTCLDLLVHLELNNKEPFQIQPFSCKEEHKQYLDKEMKKGCMLGYLNKP